MRTETVHRQRVMIRIMTKDRMHSAHQFIDIIHRQEVSAEQAIDRTALKQAMRELLQKERICFTDKNLRDVIAGLCENAVLSHNQINATFLTERHLYQLRINPSVEEKVPAGDNDNTSEKVKARG